MNSNRVKNGDRSTSNNPNRLRNDRSDSNSSFKDVSRPKSSNSMSRMINGSQE